MWFAFLWRGKGKWARFKESLRTFEKRFSDSQNEKKNEENGKFTF